MGCPAPGWAAEGILRKMAITQPIATLDRRRMVKRECAVPKCSSHAKERNNRNLISCLQNKNHNGAKAQNQNRRTYENVLNAGTTDTEHEAPRNRRAGEIRRLRRQPASALQPQASSCMQPFPSRNLKNRNDSLVPRNDLVFTGNLWKAS